MNTERKPENPPAFPIVFQADARFTDASGDCAYVDAPGMTLRDYFATHAPSDAQSWFEPKIQPRPSPEYDHDHPNERRCHNGFDCPPVNAEALHAYDDERRKQYELQWPYAWADAMLAERSKS